MRLMKLLSVSTTFVGGQNQAGRYKMAGQGMLPKFAPVGRPISPARKKGKAEEAPWSPVHATLQTATAASQVGSARAVLVLDPPREEAPPDSRHASSVVTAAVSEPASAVCVDAIRASTNWFRWHKNLFTSRPAEAIRPQPPVQTELSLDAVKPVRNDLSDADLEVVAGQLEKRPAGPHKPAGARTLKAELTGLGWSRLAARLFNSERART